MRSSYEPVEDDAPSPEDIRLPSGDELDEMRRQKGLTVEEVADLAGIGRHTFSRIVHQGQDCRLSTLRDIMAALRDADPRSNRQLGNNGNNCGGGD
jgi:predicted transcriptional regulator